MARTNDRTLSNGTSSTAEVIWRWVLYTNGSLDKIERSGERAVVTSLKTLNAIRQGRSEEDQK